MGIVDRREQVALLHEAGDQCGVGRQFGTQKLRCNVDAGLPVRGSEDLAHCS